MIFSRQTNLRFVISDLDFVKINTYIVKKTSNNIALNHVLRQLPVGEVNECSWNINDRAHLSVVWHHYVRLRVIFENWVVLRSVE